MGNPVLVNVLISVALGIPRILGYKSQAYQAIAHLYVGGLFAAWWTGGNRGLLWIAIGLSILELACFLWFRLVRKDGQSNKVRQP